MPKTILLLVAVSAMAWPLSAAVKKKPVKKHPHVTTASHKTTKTAKSKISKSKAVAGHRRSYQQAPTPERYKEIQQALVSKGYLHGEPTGQWDADSADALKRFQTDQNLTPDGKLSSLSLIALGLGPKRLSAQTHSQPTGDGPKTDVPR